MRSVQPRSSMKRRRLTAPSEAPTTRTPGVGRKRQDLTVPAEITKLDFLKYRLHERADEFGLFHAGKLFHQFFIDGWASVEQDRLNWVREHQKEIRAVAYNGVVDSITSADSEITPDRIGKRLILPSTHLGSDRHMQKLFQDSMAIVRFFGKPDLFITFTANPHWKEIPEGGQSGTDRVDLVTRVFNLKLQSLLEELKDGIFGTLKGLVRTIEFQKRGLPHCHILPFLDRDTKFTTPEQIDKVVCAEIPDPDQEPNLYAIVTKFMMHGPCGELNPDAPCMTEDKRTRKMKCSKGFPKAFQPETEIHEDGYPLYRRRDTGRQVPKYVKGRGVVYLDNRWVVPYNPYLSLKYEAHINVEVCATVKSVKYIHKYIYIKVQIEQLWNSRRPTTKSMKSSSISMPATLARLRQHGVF